MAFADEDALDLLLGLTGLNQTDYIIRGAEPVQTEQMNALRLGAERRLAGDPVDRILGWREFYGRRFVIDDVLSQEECAALMAKAEAAGMTFWDQVRRC